MSYFSDEEIADAKTELAKLAASTRVTAGLLAEEYPAILATYAKAFFDAYTSAGLPPEIVGPLVIRVVEALGKPGE